MSTNLSQAQVGALVKVLDLFCGCGGLSAGFKLAGYEVAAGIDADQKAISTYALNFPAAQTFCEPIESFSEKKIQKLFGKEKITIVVGGPPCQGFSNANRWQKERNDPRNALFYDFIRFVEVIKPKIVVIENVRGILTHKNGYAAQRIKSILSAQGYGVDHAMLNAANYGVPQNRIRAFFIGVRNSKLRNEISFPTIPHKDAVTVRDAIGELYRFESRKSEIYWLREKPSSKYRNYLRSIDNSVYDHQIVYPADITQERIRHVPQGGNWRDIPAELFSNSRSNRHSSAFKRLNEEDASVTIDTGNAHSNYFHPKFNRIPTVREAARLQSFKDSFRFVGPRSSQYRQIGNAVPPLLGAAIAEALREFI